MSSTPLVNEPPQRPVYIDFLDVARTLSILTIVCFHFAHLMNQPSLFGELFMGARVPIMFLVAAYFFKAHDRLRWRNRVLSLTVTYFLWEAIYYIFRFGISGQAPAAFPDFAWEKLAHTFFLHELYPVNGAAWFLRALLIFTLLSPLLEKLGSMLIIAAVLLLLVFNLYSHHAGDFSLLTRHVQGLAYYMFGLSLRSIDRNAIIHFVRMGRYFFLPLYIIMHSLYLWNAQALPWLYELTIIVGGLGMISLSSFVVDCFPVLKKLMRKLSGSCYFIFMAHYVFLFSFVQFALPSLQEHCPSLFARGNATALVVGLLCIVTCYSIWVVGQRFFPRLFDYLGAFPIGKNYRSS